MDYFINQMEPWFDDKEADACYNYMKTGGWLMEFNKTKEFEKMICNYTGSKYCHIVNNGTISLSVGLLALGITKNDKVIVPNYTMIATPNSVKLIGAEPILVDIDEETLCMDLNKVEEIIYNNKDIKCIIHVSLNARMNNIEKLIEICKINNISLLEDSAQSLGSFYKNKHIGTFGNIGSFSFSAPKIISTGQGGALITNDEELSKKIYKLKNFGRMEGFNDIHDEFGINCKTTDIQSVIGIEQMKKLPWRVNRMREIWNIYYSRLSNNNNIIMIKPNDDGWIPWFIDIYVDNRDALQQYLKNNNIGSRFVYSPISSQKIYLTAEEFKISNKYCNKGIWLPSSSKLTDCIINKICDIILEFYK